MNRCHHPPNLWPARIAFLISSAASVPAGAHYVSLQHAAAFEKFELIWMWGTVAVLRRMIRANASAKP